MLQNYQFTQINIRDKVTLWSEIEARKMMRYLRSETVSGQKNYLIV